MEPVARRERLIDKREELASQLAALTAVPVDPTGSVSFGKRIGDGTAEAVERLSTTGAARQLYAQARLEARPWSVRCLTCSAAA